MTQRQLEVFRTADRYVQSYTDQPRFSATYVLVATFEDVAPDLSMIDTSEVRSASLHYSQVHLQIWVFYEKYKYTSTNINMPWFLDRLDYQVRIKHMKQLERHNFPLHVKKQDEMKGRKKGRMCERSNK